jgi:mannose-6-phosphate isomerase class I
MLILDTINKTTIWGGTRLQKYGSDPLNPHVGSLYTVAANEDLTNTVLNGPFIGMTLHDVYRDNRELFGYDKYEPFPLLIGFVDASDDLSIQLHPHDAYAQQYENAPFGKTESWYFLEAPVSGTIANGCLCNSLEELNERVAAAQWDQVIDYLPVKKGEYVFVETGTLHAMRAGSLVYEIQQSTDVTYRFYDYDRVDKDGNKRPLQLESALKNVDVSKKSSAVPYEDDKDYDEIYYSTKKTHLCGAYTNENSTFVTVTLLAGSIFADGMPVTAGMSIVVLPGESFSFTGEADVIIARPL